MRPMLILLVMVILKATTMIRVGIEQDAWFLTPAFGLIKGEDATAFRKPSSMAWWLVLGWGPLYLRLRVRKCKS